MLILVTKLFFNSAIIFLQVRYHK